MDLDKLSLQLNLSSDFLRKIYERFKPKSEAETIKLANEINAMKSEVGEDATDDDVIDFYEFQQETKKPSLKADLASRQEQPEQKIETPEGAAPATEAKNQELTQEIAGEKYREQVREQGERQSLQYDPQNIPRSQNPEKTQELAKKMLGDQAVVTQDFGNYNPELEPRQGINWGTDISVPGGKANVKNPYDDEVEVLRVVDGYGDGGVGRFDQNQGYGNQVVVRNTRTGEVSQISHLEKGIKVKQGDRIKPGQDIGVMGKSGNVTGAHVDIETFNPEGKIKDPADTISSTQEDQVPNQETIQTIQDVQKEQPIEQQANLPIEATQAENNPLQPPVGIPEDTASKVLQFVPENLRERAAQELPRIADALQKEGILTPNTLAFAVSAIGAESGFDPSRKELLAQRGLNQRNDYVANLQDRYSGGKDYSGRGLIQLTHDYNYKKYGDRLGVDLVSNPELAADPDISTRVMAAYLKDSGAADLADSGDFINARARVQGQGALNNTFMPKTREIANTSRSIAQSVKPEELQKITAPKVVEPAKIEPPQIEDTTPQLPKITPQISVITPQQDSVTNAIKTLAQPKTNIVQKKPEPPKPQQNQSQPSKPSTPIQRAVTQPVQAPKAAQAVSRAVKAVAKPAAKAAVKSVVSAAKRVIGKK